MVNTAFMTITITSSKRSSRGFTLVEVMVASTLGTLVLAGILTTFLMLGRSGANVANYSIMEAESRRGLEELSQACERHALLLPLELVQVLVQVHPVQELHHQTQLASDPAAHIEQLDSGGAFQRAQRLLLSHQALDQVRLAHRLGAQHLHGDRPVHPAIARAIHRPLPATANDGFELVTLSNELTCAIRVLRHEAKGTTIGADVRPSARAAGDAQAAAVRKLERLRALW